MTTSLSVYQRMPDPISAAKELGSAIAKSQMFGAESESQGMVLAMHCMVRQCDPLTLVEIYHLMHGKLTLKAEEMLARVVRDGGKYEIIEHSPDAAEIEITYQGRTMRERFSWEDAKLEPFVYAGKPKDIMPDLLAGRLEKLTIGTNYATPRRRMQHLWARVVSDSVRVVAPNLLGGKYTPEETHQAAIDDGKIPANAKMVEPTEESEAFEAQFEVKQETLAPERVETAEDKELGRAIREITELFGLLGVPADKQLSAIQKRGATDMGSLSLDGANDLLAALRDMAKTPSDDAPAQSSPITAEHVEHIRTLLAQVAQLPGGQNIGDRVRTKLRSSGFERLADLSKADGDLLEHAIAMKNMELFFDAALQGYSVARKAEDDAKNG